MEQNAARDTLHIRPDLLDMMEEEVGKAREKNYPITRAFEAVAKQSGLKLNTIRNYYYRSRTERPEPVDGEIRRGLGRAFSDDEIDDLMKEMLAAQAKGESVRGCARRLANNDPQLLLRYQNKYRNVVAKRKPYVMELIREMREKGVESIDPYEKERLSKKDNTRDKDQLLATISELMENIKQIPGCRAETLFDGLLEMSRAAIEGVHTDEDEDEAQYLGGRLSEMERMARHAKAEALSYKQELEYSQNQLQRVQEDLERIKQVNRDFLKLPQTEKLAGMSAYLEYLSACTGKRQQQNIAE
jgi:hypothetical protein